MSTASLAMAVVGHTNTGKTSLIRTLSQQRDFGDVADRGGTTRQVSAMPLAVDGRTLIELYDSPGLENAPGLIQTLDHLPGSRHGGPERLRRLLDDASLSRQFDQEARVLGLMLSVDIGLVVIDAREPVLEKYQDELAILGLAARPLLAVLNFTAHTDSRESQWRQALAEVGLHNCVAFDAQVRDAATEQRLFQNLQSLLPDHGPVLQTWMDHRAAEEGQRQQAGLQAIARLLLDAAACRLHFRHGVADDRERRLAQLREQVAAREQACVNTLLDLYRFGQDEYHGDALPLDDGRWTSHPLDPESLTHYGIKTGKHLGAGASAGALVDISTGGLSLGTGMLIGAALGAGTGLIRSAGGEWVDRARGLGRLSVDDGALKLLLTRQVALLDALSQRGHASTQSLLAELPRDWQSRPLPPTLRRARHHPEWSSLNGERGAAEPPESAQQDLIKELQP
ncbi:MAG: GTPase/DUF3482 domain-containing protein [Wenzhouxiangella sp.]